MLGMASRESEGEAQGDGQCVYVPCVVSRAALLDVYTLLGCVGSSRKWLALLNISPSFSTCGVARSHEEMPPKRDFGLSIDQIQGWMWLLVKTITFPSVYIPAGTEVTPQSRIRADLSYKSVDRRFDFA
jgi:hypothetical protein